ncbi:putative DNA binding domain-containing protein [Gillisia sp. M10.2A]|uniref:DNA binding domain-containing protein n=1 Tax=Gillisia lutea TaxID=2909668 RepID=A0ABS9EEA9_9FLAO|nr:RNA-binding domain-containing protein [Gillisia lutea]MCF4100110.1 putative DNA binding domain-containing protein [Gillisia lutea]
MEYKRELSDGLEKEVIAFLNYREGGIIYIGINKEGNTYGLADADGDQLKIKDRLKNNIRPSALGLFDIVSEERDGKNILKIIVASGPEKPYHFKKYGMSEKGCFIRLGSAAEPMPQKMIDELFAKRTRNSISKIKAGRQDLSFGQLKIYYEESGHTLGKAFAKNLELLTEDGTFNYAGYLLADKNNTSIKVAKYSGKTRTDLIESNEYGYECLLKATKQVIDKIAVENRTNTKITAKERQQANLWNPIALREAIINAFVHNDYTNEITPKFEIFADRIEITSAGGLPEGLSKQEFFEGFSVPRNKELMRIFKDLELVEQLGSGIPRILEHYGKESFGFSDNFLRMTFNAKETAVEEGGQIGGQIGGQKDAEIDDIKKLTHRQKEVLKLITSDNRISRSGIAEVLHINESAIQKHLNNLKNAGFIERVGGTRGYWEINLDKN